MTLPRYPVSMAWWLRPGEGQREKLRHHAGKPTCRAALHELAGMFLPLLPVQHRGEDLPLGTPGSEDMFCTSAFGKIPVLEGPFIKQVSCYQSLPAK